MKPRYIAYIIWITIALLGVVCTVVPDSGWQVGTKTLRWPTLAEVLMIDNDDSEILQDSTWLSMVDSTWLSVIDTTEIVSDTKTIEELTYLEDTIHMEQPALPKEKPVPEYGERT